MLLYGYVCENFFIKLSQTNSVSFRLETLSKIADIYGTSIDYLLERTDEISPYPNSK